MPVLSMEWASRSVRSGPRPGRSGRRVGDPAPVKAERNPGREVHHPDRAVREGPEHQAVSMPKVPAPEDCEDADFIADVVLYARHLRIRLTDDALLPSDGRPETDVARLRAWIRPAGPDPTRTAAAMALIMLDALPPSLYAVTRDPVPIPSVDTGIQFTDRVGELGDQDWAFVEVITERTGAGWLVENGSLWSRDGTLLAASRQARRVLG